jgi:predicted transcriptional regulator
MERERIVLSVRPNFANAILDGHKTVEFRRVRPALPAGTRIYLYATAPSKSIVGSCRVLSIHSDTPAAIWKKFSNRGAITKRDFLDYFRGSAEAVAIEIDEVESLGRPVSLEALQDAGKFWPPQFYRRVNAGDGLSGLLPA